MASGLQKCHSASSCRCFYGFSKYFNPYVQPSLKTPPCTQMLFFSAFSNRATSRAQACTQANNDLQCRRRMHRPGRNDSNVVRFFNCYAFTFLRVQVTGVNETSETLMTYTPTVEVWCTSQTQSLLNRSWQCTWCHTDH